MKKILILLAVLILSGCCSMGKPAIYQSGEHFAFSAWGYKTAGRGDVLTSNFYGWWGCPVYVTGPKVGDWPETKEK
jgi:uncharacterized protein YceK